MLTDYLDITGLKALHKGDEVTEVLVKPYEKVTILGMVVQDEVEQMCLGTMGNVVTAFGFSADVCYETGDLSL